MKADNILETIGNTPMIKMQRLFPGSTVWIKSERANPGGSIKDRIALKMVEAAEASGQLKPGGTIVEPTSGNTGVGLAMVGAVKGYKVILTMPDSMSIERRRLMLCYGAELRLTPKELGIKESIRLAEEIVSKTEGAWMPMQFENPVNVDAHVERTAQEIINDFKGETVDALVTGVGTGGHLTGCAREMKKVWPDLHVAAVEPELSPVISGGEHTPHPIQGIGAGFVPDNLDRAVLDDIVQVDAEKAKEMARRAAREEGMLVGISSGATLEAIRLTIEKLGPGKTIVGFNYDTGERYLSVDDFLPEEA